ncbi:MAG: hypothetical protein IJM26_10960 [Lachnospiraceae bacterium]|nr:hypothetical protein [Lachnospiraceae bacterium]
MPAEEEEEATATMYFTYHNDDAADLNIKFILESVTDDELADYLSNGDFFAAAAALVVLVTRRRREDSEE